MKILFLDFDGVLNSVQSTRMYYVKNGRQGVACDETTLCPLALANLSYIMEAVPDLNIVISSSWRVFHPLKDLQMFLQDGAGIDPARVLDITPYLRSKGLTDPSPVRGDEIREWLICNTTTPSPGVLLPLYPVDDFIIIDDDSDMAEYRDTEHFLQTDHYLGLTIRDAQKIILKLGGDTDGW